MKRTCSVIAAGGLSLFASTQVAAATMTNPDPVNYAADSEDGYVLVSNSVAVFEALDSFAGSFGFYFASDPGTLITLFAEDDQGGTQTAAIDFGAGGVFDSDDGFAPQAAFTGSVAPGPVGLWYSAAGFTFYSDPALNGGTDFAGTFTLLGDAFTTLVTFEEASLGIFSMNVLQGVLPVSAATAPVPVPAALPLMLSVLGAGALRGVRRQAG